MPCIRKNGNTLEEKTELIPIFHINATGNTTKVVGTKGGDESDNFGYLDDEPFGLSDLGEGISPINKAPSAATISSSVKNLPTKRAPCC